jgi:ornithine decarboxylase
VEATKTIRKEKSIQQKAEARFLEVKKRIAKMTSSGEYKDSFYIFDIENVSQRIKIWRNLLPRVEIFYAVKTNTDSKIIQKCLQNGTGFDVASAAEITHALKLGANAEKCIYASPIKKVSHLLIAK